jgi:hypothetical protein
MNRQQLEHLILAEAMIVDDDTIVDPPQVSTWGGAAIAAI